MPGLRRRAHALALAVTAVVAVSCTGPRPNVTGALSPSGSPAPTPPPTTGDAAVDAVLARLDRVGSTTFTAGYRLTRRLGETSADAKVTQEPPRLVVEVRGDVFVVGPQTKTCAPTTKRCEDGIAAQRIADVATGIFFYGPSAAVQIRVSMARRRDPARVEERTIAGQPASCALIDVGTGTETYCVVPSGVVALVDRADVIVQLDSFTTTADGALLAAAS